LGLVLGMLEIIAGAAGDGKGCSAGLPGSGRCEAGGLR